MHCLQKEGPAFWSCAPDEKKGASAPRKARASTRVAVPDNPLALLSVLFSGYTSRQRQINPKYLQLSPSNVTRPSSTDLRGEMEGEVTHRCVCRWCQEFPCRLPGHCSCPATSACSPSRGATRNHGRCPHASTKSPLRTDGCQKNKNPPWKRGCQGLRQRITAQPWPPGGLGEARLPPPPPRAAAASEAGGLRAPSGGCSGDVGAPLPPAARSRAPAAVFCPEPCPACG